MRSKPITKRGYLPWLIAATYALVVLMLIGAAVVSVLMDRPVYVFISDIAAISEVSPFYGVISTVGILFWCASAAICFFSSLLIRREKLSLNFVWFFLISGIFTMILMLDDLFMLHEHIIPKFLRIPQRAILAGYPILAVLYLIRFRATIVQTYYEILLLAFGFLAISVVLDVIPNFLADWRPLFEDGAKLLGIVSWFVYLSSACYLKLERIILPKVLAPPAGPAETE